jgi:hypothetical protein
VSSVNFCIIATPKLEREAELLQLREHYAPSVIQLEPHTRITGSWVPVELGEVMAVIEFISKLRKNLHPLAITVENWQEAGELVIGQITQGREELLAIRQSITGTEPLPLLKTETDSLPALILLRIPDARERTLAVADANRIGRTLGVIDSLILIRTLPDRSWHRVARFPFGVGRVDFYERLSI